MSKIGIFTDNDSPKYLLNLIDEGDTIDLDVRDSKGEWLRTLIRIDKSSLQVTAAKGDKTDFETNRKGEVEIYEQ